MLLFLIYPNNRTDISIPAAVILRAKGIFQPCLVMFAVLFICFRRTIYFSRQEDSEMQI